MRRMMFAFAALAACGAGAITATKEYVDGKIEPLCTIQAFEDFCRTNSVLIGGPYLPAESEISSNLFSAAWMSGPVWPYRRWSYRMMDEDWPARPVLFDFGAGAMMTKGMLLKDGWWGLAALIQADYPDRTVTTQALPYYVEAKALEPVTGKVWSAWHVVPAKWKIIQDSGSALTLRADSIDTEAESQISGVTWVHYNSSTVTGLASNISGVYAWRSKVHKHGHALEADRIADRAEFEAAIKANAAAIETNAMRIADNAAGVSALGTNTVTKSDFDDMTEMMLYSFAPYVQYTAATGYVVCAGVTNAMTKQDMYRGWLEVGNHAVPMFTGLNGFRRYQVMAFESYDPFLLNAWYREAYTGKWKRAEITTFDPNLEVLSDEDDYGVGWVKFTTTHVYPAGVTNVCDNYVFFHARENIAYQSDIKPAVSNALAGAAGNFATKQSVTVVSNLAASADTKVNTLVAYVQGDDVMDVVTNYDSAVHMPSRSLRQKIEDGGTNVWRVVWDEMTRWDWFMNIYLPTNYYNKAEVDAALDDKADRAWGYYDSHTGGWSPDNYLQISSSKILIAAGMAYQRHVTTGGAVWVLESNGLVTEVGGVSSNGFFRISDDEGNALFEIVKGNKRTIGSTAGALTTTNIMGVTHMYITYAVESGEHPTIEATSDLGTAFVSEDSASSLVNVTWSGSSGDWHAEVWPKVASSSMFVRASHEIGGETYIKNTAPTGLDGGIIYNGVRYRIVPYSTGGKTYLTLEAW